MNSRLLKTTYLAVIACFFVLPALQAQVTESQEREWLNSPAASSHIGKLTGNAHAATEPYRRYCMVCHGQLGDGNGESAQWIDPKPRDFTLGVF